MKAIYGQELAPSLADRYLAEQGYDAQQTSEPVSPNRPDDLFEPVPGPFAARGIFTDRAKDVSVQT